MFFSLKQSTAISCEILTSCHDWNYSQQKCRSIGQVLECAVLAVNVVSVFLRASSKFVFSTVAADSDKVELAM